MKFGHTDIRQPKFIGSHPDTIFVIHPFLSCFFNNKKHRLKNESSLNERSLKSQRHSQQIGRGAHPFSRRIASVSNTVQLCTIQYQMKLHQA